MKLLVTGAGGFLGRYVVDEALRRGHVVRAMVRSAGAAAKYGWEGNPNIEITVADLRSRRGLVDAVAGVDAVLHLAAAKGGDVYAQYGGTVVATENLLWAMTEAKVSRIVLVSSFSVYDYMKVRGGSLFDESAPLEEDAFERDGYAHTKLVQERLVREHAERHGWTWTVLRPGVIIGRDNLWSARLGMQGGRVWVRIGGRTIVPITYAGNTAEAIVMSAEKESAAGQVFNVVDDEQPRQRDYVNLLRDRTTPRPKIVPVSWTVMRSVARLASLTNKLVLGNRARLPGLFIPCRVHARFKPLKYSNRKIKEMLGWKPRVSLLEAVERSLGDERNIPASPLAASHETAAPTPPSAPPAPLRIAYMTGEYPRATDTFIQREVAALRESGVHVETLSVRRPPEKELVSDEVRAERQRTYYLLPANPLTVAVAHLRLLFGVPGQYLSAVGLALRTRPPGLKALVWQAAYFAEAALVARRMRDGRLSHLHNHFSNSSCSVAMLASAMGGFSYSFTMHGPAEFYEPKYWRIDEKVRRAKFVACISHFARSQAMVFAPQAAWDKLHVVHCGVSPEQFARVEHRGRGSRLLFVGRLAAVKGLPVLLEAVAILAEDRPDVKLVVAGDGPDRSTLEAQAKRLGIWGNVQFLGYQSQAQVRELLKRTDAFVMASFAEGVPVVLMEAMAAGVPVVSTRIAGVPELVEDGASGYLVPPGEPRVVAEKAALLLDDAELRSRLGAAGREKVEREFNIATEAGRLVRIMTTALGATVSASAETSAAGILSEKAAAPEHEELAPQAALSADETWRAAAPAGA